MSFNPDFWVATATAAPVIALSSIVLINDQGTIIGDARSRKILFGNFIGTVFRAATISYLLNGINLLLQFTIFTVSLGNLATEGGIAIPEPLTAFVEGFSIIFLFFSTGIIVVCRVKIRVHERRAQEAQEADDRSEGYNKRKMENARRALIRISNTSNSTSKAYRKRSTFKLKG